MEGEAQLNYPVRAVSRGEQYFRKFKERHDPKGLVHLRLSSQYPDVKDYLTKMHVSGACSCEDDGTIFILIDDSGTATTVTWLEELGHALQYMRSGFIPISCDDDDRRTKELEVLDCLLSRKDKFRLRGSEVDDCEMLRHFYGATP